MESANTPTSLDRLQAVSLFRTAVQLHRLRLYRP